MVLREVEIAGELIDADFEGFHEIFQEDFTGVDRDELGAGHRVYEGKAKGEVCGVWGHPACGPRVSPPELPLRDVEWVPGQRSTLADTRFPVSFHPFPGAGSLWRIRRRAGRG